MLVDTIQVNYLVVGHTNCPIDQKLGALSTIIHQQESIATQATLMHKLTDPEAQVDRAQKGKIVGKYNSFIALKHVITCLHYVRSLWSTGFKEVDVIYDDFKTAIAPCINSTKM
jgi:hypothetical protein